MTTIAYLPISNIPTLFGDLLVTSPEPLPPNKGITLPAIGTVPSSARDRHPVLLQQKVCIINSNLAVAWSGPLFVAQSVIRGLRRTFPANAPVDMNSLNAVFAEYDVVNLKDFEFIGMIMENGVVTPFGTKTSPFHQDGVGTCFVSGSGADKLRAMLPSVGAPAYVEGSMTDADRAVTAGLSFAVEFLLEELLAGLQDTHFGGGFEIAIMTPHGVMRVGDVLTLFWRHDREQPGRSGLLPVMIKWDYVGDELVLQRLRHEVNSEGQHELQEHDITSVWAPGVKPIPRSTPIDLNYTYLCVCYFSVDAGRIVRRTSSVLRCAKGTGPIRFEDSDHHLNITYDWADLNKRWEMARGILA